MTRILLLGLDPPPLVGNARIEAAHYRTWQFLEPLLADDHQICLSTTGDPDAPRPAVPAGWSDRLVYHPVPFGRRGWPARLQDIHDEFDPEAIVAVNFSHALYACKLRRRAPLWMDIYGDMLTIMQAYCYRQGSDRGLATTIAFMREVLRQGDIFSVCGTPQQHALVGQLALSGRLNHRTFGYDFVQVVLPASPPSASPPPGQAAQTRRRERLGALDIGPDEFVVLWAGGYNTWTDVDTLFQGLEQAMAQSPDLHYVSVGANTYEAPDNVYDRLRARVAGSPFAGRYHFLGWRPWAEMADYYRESDLGINIDARHYETIYGTRTRLMEMIAVGLPVITTRGAELSHLLEQAGAAVGFTIGDWSALGQLVAGLAADRARCRALGARAQAYASETLSFAATTRPVREWVRQPQVAPDRVAATGSARLAQWEYQARARARRLLWRLTGQDA